MTTRTSPRTRGPRRPAPSGARAPASHQGRPSARPPQRRRTLWIWGGIGGAAIAVIIGLFVVFRGASSGGSAGGPTFTVGAPGVGAKAPSLALASTAGGTFDLSAQRGKTVLLYFQEGVGCEPCWTQMQDIQSQMPSFTALGINEVVSISSDDDIGVLRQKASDEGITAIPVLSDPGLAVSHAYNAPSYGMMMGSKDGHTFIVVGPDGTIKWRADYGGSPDYTMYVKPSDLLAQLRRGLAVK